MRGVLIRDGLRPFSHALAGTLDAHISLEFVSVDHSVQPEHIAQRMYLRNPTMYRILWPMTFPSWCYIRMGG